MQANCVYMQAHLQAHENLNLTFFEFNIPHGRFRNSTACRHKSTSDFKNSNHKTARSKKKIAARKALQKKNREARETQEKFFETQQKELDEAKIKTKELENAQIRSTDPPVESSKNVLTTTQWLSVISIIVGGSILQTRRDQKRF